MIDFHNDVLVITLLRFVERQEGDAGNAGQLASIALPDGTVVNYVHDKTSRLLTEVNVAGTGLQETLTYDPFDRVRTWTSTEGFTLTYDYDALDHLTKVTYPDGTGYRYLYDAAGRIVAVDDLAGQPIERHQYDAQGRAVTSEVAGGVEKLTFSFQPDRTVVTDALGDTLFKSGRIDGTNEVEGHDATYEPHYDVITDGGQVQIYEDIMVGPNNVPTTGLLTAVRFIKDNRLLPRGFEKRAVGQEIAPQGEAMGDTNFVGGGDKIRYSIAVGEAQGPFQVDAELWFQPISYRWATNLKSYSGKEPERFTRYYEAMATGSGLMIHRASASR